MIFTEFDPLQSVIVGDIYSPGDIDHLLPKKSLASFNRILEETKEDLDNLANFLQKGNIEVKRPTVYDYPEKINLPNFIIDLPISPVVPRDQYKIQGDVILQTYTSYTDRYFDNLSYYSIFRELFEQGYNWLSQPSPMLQDLKTTDLWYMNCDTYHEKLSDRLLWHTATMFSVGDDIIINARGPGTELGYQWLQRNLRDFRFIENRDTIVKNYGHIDHGFIMIDDETVIHAGEEWVPSALKNKKLIDVKRFLPELNLERYKKDFAETNGKYDIEWLDRYLENWRGYNQEVCFDLNVLIIDRNNIVFGREIPELFSFLKRFGIECHVCQQRHMLYWEGGIHCSTLDLKRKGHKRSII